MYRLSKWLTRVLTQFFCDQFKKPAELAEELGEQDIAAVSRAQLEKGLAALETLWNDDIGQYTCYDRVTGELSSVPSVGGILAAFAPINSGRAAQIAGRISAMKDYSTYAVPSHDPKDAEYDGERYWRGPVWLIVNYMIANGLARAGQSDVANIIEKDSLTLIEQSGFAEYYDPNYWCALWRWPIYVDCCNGY
jgi:glycogen debranching enzyme